MDFMSMTLKELTSIDGISSLEKEAERLHIELVSTVKSHPRKSWMMTANEIEADEQSSFRAISEYSGALKARLSSSWIRRE